MKKRAVKRKQRMVYKQRHGMATEHDINSTQLALSKTIKSVRRNDLNKFYGRGINAQASGNMQQAWRWVKQHSGLTAIKKSVEAVYMPGTKKPAKSLQERKKIWEEHFPNLCAKPCALTYKLSSPCPSGKYTKVTRRPVTYIELQEDFKKPKNNKATGLEKLTTVWWVILSEKEGARSLGRYILRSLN
ncbi:hypothetical protein EDEG_03719 [Edhazardia aedis USNM 41457]|uniref:Uncharacterized protein n=1 Tax=Edhazardia aedis (strain USNM 41457) TaxID=1003232 RepID=J9D2I8_EDHAE|nr:hypothetical protein EDEG_03719 [Edhazardia aedis USNM 41457]|eukprot:EJW01794.1 hypothetical protein EDEG_03719 [Edhazardia aedis USNM 41457]